jgi:predicted RNA-binding Zn ribbon-like protein
MIRESPTSGFKFIGGLVCLDFINTAEGRTGGSRASAGEHYKIIGEKLKSYTDLIEWCRHEQTGLLSASAARALIQLAKKHPKAAQSVCETAICLREALYRIFRAIASERRPNQADIEKLNEELKTGRAHEKLVFSSGAFTTKWEEVSEKLDSPLWPVARSAGELLTSGDSSRLRQCAGEDCGWLFIDTSRNRSRQWCDMKDCGNLAKVRRFRQRQQEV